MRKSTLLALVSLLVLFVLQWLFPPMNGVTDLPSYVRIGVAVETLRNDGGGMLTSEYPPLVAVLFYLLNNNYFDWSFSTAWSMFMGLVFIGVVAYAVLFLAEHDRWLFALAVVLVVPLLDPLMVFSRFDYLVVVPLFLMWRAHRQGRFFDSAMFLVLASFIKLVPVVIFPILFFFTPRGQRKRLLFGAVVSAVILSVLVLVVVGFRPALQGVSYMISFQRSGGISVESTWSAFDLLVKNLYGEKSKIVHNNGAFRNASLGPSVALVARVALFAGISFTYALAWVRRRYDRPSSFILYVLFLLLWLVSVSPFFSPQYLVWFMPLIIVWLLERVVHQPVVDAKTIIFITLVAIIGILSRWVFPLHYEQLLAQDSLWPTLVLVVRNVLLLALSWLFCWMIVVDVKRRIL